MAQKAVRQLKCCCCSVVHSFNMFLINFRCQSRAKAGKRQLQQQLRYINEVSSLLVWVLLYDKLCFVSVLSQVYKLFWPLWHGISNEKKHNIKNKTQQKLMSHKPLLNMMAIWIFNKFIVSWILCWSCPIHFILQLKITTYEHNFMSSSDLMTCNQFQKNYFLHTNISQKKLKAFSKFLLNIFLWGTLIICWQ